MTIITTTSRTFFDAPCLIACDGQCQKAWGISDRPWGDGSDDPDDTEYLADRELPQAPNHPGTWEGGETKPAHILPNFRHNKWCFRECERSSIGLPGQLPKLPDFSQRVRNIPEEAKS